MADDRNDRDSQNDRGDDLGQTNRDGKRVIGRGMTSPDSTQVPLRADTGEPDEDAIKGRIPEDADQED